jgi:hypothetical protein
MCHWLRSREYSKLQMHSRARARRPEPSEAGVSRWNSKEPCLDFVGGHLGRKSFDTHLVACSVEYQGWHSIKCTSPWSSFPSNDWLHVPPPRPSVTWRSGSVSPKCRTRTPVDGAEVCPQHPHHPQHDNRPDPGKAVHLSATGHCPLSPRYGLGRTSA